jgi:hypothetical protein
MNVFFSILYFYLSIKSISSTIYNSYLKGNYLLRKTNDISFKSKYTYLIIDDNNNIKLKTINENGIIATKVSRTGCISIEKNILKKLFYSVKKKINYNNINSYNNYDLILTFKNINKYSYSFFGIEFPEIRYNQINDYNIRKKINVIQQGYTIYVTDEYGNYYLFDLFQNLNKDRLPYIEIPANTLIVTQVFGFLINIILVKIFDIL